MWYLLGGVFAAFLGKGTRLPKEQFAGFLNRKGVPTPDTGYAAK